MHTLTGRRQRQTAKAALTHLLSHLLGLNPFSLYPLSSGSFLPVQQTPGSADGRTVQGFKGSRVDWFKGWRVDWFKGVQTCWTRPALQLRAVGGCLTEHLSISSCRREQADGEPYPCTLAWQAMLSSPYIHVEGYEWAHTSLLGLARLLLRIQLSPHFLVQPKHLHRRTPSAFIHLLQPLCTLSSWSLLLRRSNRLRSR